MLNIGAGEFILIVVVALLVLGPQRLPEFARTIGKFLREFRRQTDEMRTMVEHEFYRMDQELDRPPAPAPIPEVNPGSPPQTHEASASSPAEPAPAEASSQAAPGSSEP